MKADDISVELRLAHTTNGKVKAFADVTIPLGLDGVITMLGFSVFHADGQRPSVAPPARKGEKRYFEVVTLNGKVRSVVDEAILNEYDRQTDTREE